VLLLGDIVRRHARYRAAKTAYVLDHADGRVERVSYAEFDGGANRLARTLAKAGVRRGDRVAILAQNCVEYPWAYIACCRLGAILVPVNTRYRREEIRYAMDFAAAKVALVGEEFADELIALVRAGSLRGLERLFALGSRVRGKSVEGLAVARVWLPEVLADESPADFVPDDPPDERDPHVMLYTSGTTGVPKGALLSQRSYYLQAGNTQVITGQTERDVGLSMFPMFHMGGWAMPLGYWSIGASIVIMRKADSRAMLAAVERERVTYLYAVPTVYESMLALAAFGRFDLSSLRALGGGTAYMPREQIERITRAFGTENMVVMYGQTEAGPISCLRAHDLMRKAGSVGTPVSHVDVRIVDAAGRDVPVGVPGEIVVRSDLTMLGYWRMPEATTEAFVGGWLHTGDQAIWDEEGFIHIVGRLKEMIKTGGENVFPAEVEQVLARHPDVAECAVLGVPDPEWSEAVLAVVVARTGAELHEHEVIEFVKRELAGYKKPRHVRFVDELPRTASTRQVQKALLRDRFVQGW
jgi:fatty-acyl-CoA synthase